MTERSTVKHKFPCARALVIHSIYGQTHAYAKSIVALKGPVTQTFASVSRVKFRDFFLPAVARGGKCAKLAYPRFTRGMPAEQTPATVPRPYRG